MASLGFGSDVETWTPALLLLAAQHVVLILSESIRTVLFQVQGSLAPSRRV